MNQKVNRFFSDGIFSVVAALAFCAYNAVLGASKRYSFAICMAVYYFLLTAIRIGISAGSVVTRKSDGEDDGKIRRLCACSSWLLLALNVALIAPIVLLVKTQRDFSLGMIPAITTAAYCTYKMTIAIIRYVKKKTKTPLEQTRNTVALVDAATSVLILQNTLIMATGSGGADDMLMLTSYTSFGIYALIVILSVLLCVKLKKSSPKANERVDANEKSAEKE